MPSKKKKINLNFNKGHRPPLGLLPRLPRPPLPRLDPQAPSRALSHDVGLLLRVLGRFSLGAAPRGAADGLRRVQLCLSELFFFFFGFFFGFHCARRPPQRALAGHARRAHAARGLRGRVPRAGVLARRRAGPRPDRRRRRRRGPARGRRRGRARLWQEPRPALPLGGRNGQRRQRRRRRRRQRGPLRGQVGLLARALAALRVALRARAAGAAEPGRCCCCWRRAGAGDTEMEERAGC